MWRCGSVCRATVCSVARCRKGIVPTDLITSPAVHRALCTTVVVLVRGSPVASLWSDSMKMGCTYWCRLECALFPMCNVMAHVPGICQHLPSQLLQCGHGSGVQPLSTATVVARCPGVSDHVLVTEQPQLLGSLSWVCGTHYHIVQCSPAFVRIASVSAK